MKDSALLAIELAAFSIVRIIFIQRIGIDLAIAVMMCAMLVRGRLVPATMRLLPSESRDVA